MIRNQPDSFSLPPCHNWLSKLISIYRRSVFANKSRKLWMDLDETWQVGLRPKRLSIARFKRNRCMGLTLGESAKKWVAEALFFCDSPLLPLSLDRFLPNFPRTRVQVASRDTWFHIPVKFPLKDRICRNPSF